MRSASKFTCVFLLSLICLPAAAQESADGRSYLDEVLASATKKTAKYYRVAEGKEGELFIGKTYTLDGKLKAEGHYADARLAVPHGAFVYYHPNGKVESRGMYVDGNKSGVWERFDAWGGALAEKVYDHEPLANILYTRAETMPEYAQGGERAFIKHVRETVSPIAGDRLKGEVTTSFVVEKNGELTDVKVVAGRDSIFDSQVVEAVKATSPWQPGVDQGRPVRVQMRVPVQF